MTEYKMAMTDVKKKTSFVFKLLPDETWHVSQFNCGMWNVETNHLNCYQKTLKDEFIKKKSKIFACFVILLKNQINN